MHPHINKHSLVHASMEHQRAHDKKKLAEDKEDFDTLLRKALNESNGEYIQSVSRVDKSPESDLNNHSTAYEQAHLMQQRRYDSHQEKDKFDRIV